MTSKLKDIEQNCSISQNQLINAGLNSITTCFANPVEPSKHLETSA